MSNIITEKNYPIEKRWLLKPIISFFILVPIFLMFLLPTLLSPSNPVETNRLIFYATVFFIFPLFSLITVVFRRATFQYSIDEKFLNLRQGILSKQNRHIPYGVIQNVLLKQDLIDRVLGVSSLIIENASQGGGVLTTPRQQTVFGFRVGNQQSRQADVLGSWGNMVSIPGLSKENANILKGIILKRMKENPIKDSQSGL